MATIFYLPSSGSADVSPTPSGTDWDGHINSVSRPLNLTRGSSALADTTYAPDGSDHIADLAVMVAQFVSPILPPQTVAAQQVTLGARTYEANAGNNLNEAWKLYGCSVDGTTNLGNLVAWFKSAINEMALSGGTPGYCEAKTTTVQTFNVPWRLVLEVGADGSPVATSGVQGHNCTWGFGETMTSGAIDLAQNDDATSPIPLLVFSNDIITSFNVAPSLNLGV